MRLFLFRLLCELRLDFLKQCIGLRERQLLEYVLYGYPPYTPPPTSLMQIKETWRKFPGLLTAWNMALFDYLTGLVNVLVKRDVFEKPDAEWAIFQASMAYFYDLCKQGKNIGIRQCTARELGWIHAVKDAKGFEPLYRQMSYGGLSESFRQFIFLFERDARHLAIRAPAAWGAPSFPYSRL